MRADAWNWFHFGWGLADDLLLWGAYNVVAYVVMAYVVMAFIVMVDVVMALELVPFCWGLALDLFVEDVPLAAAYQRLSR